MRSHFHDNSSLDCLFYEDSKFVVCNGTTYDPEEHLTSSNPLFWVYLIVYIILVLVCGVMQGLVLALCSCDMTSLKVMSQAGTGKTRKYARRMMLMAKRHHLVLVTLIVANATSATAMPIFFERLTNPITAIVVSATAFLIFGEILPQAICSRYGLPIGYYMSWVIYVMTVLFFIISYPFSLLLDWMLGHDAGTFYKRTELSALVDMHGPVLPSAEDGVVSCGISRKGVDLCLERLSADEVMVIKGALAMGQKTATQVMVKLEDVYMLASNAIVDEALAEEIFDVGHSRIPVYEGDRSNVIGVILTKRLIMMNKQQGLPISSLFSDPDNSSHLYPPYLVDESTPLFDLLNQFQTGTRTHMAFITTTALTDKDFQILGIVTLEDLIEELLQEEIKDESDLQRQWHLHVEKVETVEAIHRLTKGLAKNSKPLVRHLSVPSLVVTTRSGGMARKTSMSYIS